MRYRFYHTFAFWDALAKTMGIIGGGANVVMGVTTEVAKSDSVPDFGPYQIIFGLLSLGSLALVPWLRDHNSNGILDFFEPINPLQD